MNLLSVVKAVIIYLWQVSPGTTPKPSAKTMAMHSPAKPNGNTQPVAAASPLGHLQAMNNSSATMHGFPGIRRGQVHNVGTKRPNPLELSDMHGNAWEWVADCYDDNAYPRDHPEMIVDPVVNPNVVSSCQYRVLRGGSPWSSDPGDLAVCGPELEQARVPGRRRRLPLCASSAPPALIFWSFESVVVLLFFTCAKRKFFCRCLSFCHLTNTLSLFYRPDIVMQLTLEQAATSLGKSKRQVLYMIQNGRLPAQKLAGRWWIESQHLPLSEGPATQL